MLLNQAPVHAFERKEHNINLLIPDGLAPILIGSGGGRVGNIRKVLIFPTSGNQM